MRKIAKADKNQPDIVKTYRDAFCTVQHTHQLGGGFVDIVVGAPGVTIVSRELDSNILRYLLEKMGIKEYAIHEGANLLIEIKDGEQPPSARELTKDEKTWHETWRGQKCIVETIRQALKSIGL